MLHYSIGGNASMFFAMRPVANGCLEQRLLKALGYLSNYDGPSEINEDIQMHADALYHRMLEQEAAIEEAKKEGRPVPKLEPMLMKSAVAVKKEDFDISSMNPEAQKKWKEHLEKLPEQDRLAEEQAMKGELKAKAELASKLQGLWQEQAKEREARKSEGKETISDKVANLFGRK